MWDTLFANTFCRLLLQNLAFSSWGFATAARLLAYPGGLWPGAAIGAQQLSRNTKPPNYSSLWKLVGPAWPQGCRPKRWWPYLCKTLHILSIPARARLLVVVPWLCGHCIYI